MSELPIARPAEARSRSWLPWTIPLLACLVVGGLLWWHMRQHGPLITIRVDHAHGLTAGAALRHQGMEVGEVLDLAPREGGVLITVRLRPDAAFLAREQSRFWIVRPEIELTSVSGLDTLIGARYLAVRPGDGPRRTTFIGLPGRPVRPAHLEGALECLLTAPRRGGLRPGAPVFFRQCEIGQVLDVGLARDASAVELRLAIQRRYAGLIRSGTRFWRQGGIRVDAGLLSGVTVGVESLSALLRGGISCATPPGEAAPVANGHRFRLADQADEDWLDWTPSLPLGDLPGELADVPRPRRVAVAWTGTGFWSRKQQRIAWMLPTAGGLLGPWSLLEPLTDDPAVEDLAVEVGGERLRVAAGQVVDLGGGLGLLQDVLNAERPAPFRAPTGVEDLVCLRDGQPALLIAAARLQPEADAWQVAEGVVPDDGWHGAPVVATADGAVVGVLLVDGSTAQVATLAAEQVPRLVVAKP